MAHRWLKPNKQWFSHPLFIALISIAFTAILGSILIPYLTNQWQVNEKELDVKFDLAGDISETVSSQMAKPIKYAHLDPNSTAFPTESMLKDISENGEQCLPIRQRLVMYFPENTNLAEQWRDICASLSFYFMYSILREVESPLFSNFSSLMVEFIDDNLDLDLSQPQMENLSSFSDDFSLLQTGITNRTQDIMRSVVNSDVIGY